MNGSQINRRLSHGLGTILDMPDYKPSELSKSLLCILGQRL